MNFGPLMAEIGSGVWDTPANFNGFCVLAALLHSSGLQIGLFDVISDVNKEIVACKGSCWSLMMSVLPSLVSDIWHCVWHASSHPPVSHEVDYLEKLRAFAWRVRRVITREWVGRPRWMSLVRRFPWFISVLWVSFTALTLLLLFYAVVLFLSFIVRSFSVGRSPAYTGLQRVGRQ